ncbi:MAG TPA: hypothetical protein VEK07_14250 [Polyangiaceae bacterium]|nr:hypothetical protein [Polyangiaceae bacterium]
MRFGLDRVRSALRWSRRTTTPTALCAAFWAVLLAAKEARSDNPIVRTSATGSTLHLDAVPSSQAFDFEIVSARTRFTSGYLEVWPKVTSPWGCNRPPDTDRRQHYSLALVPAADAVVGTTGSVLRASVPPLQLGQPFCFTVHRVADLTDLDVTAIAGDLAQVAMREGTAPQGSADLAPPMEAALDADIESRFDEPVALGPAVAAAAKATAAALSRLPEFGALSTAATLRRNSEASLVATQRQFNQALEATQSLLHRRTLKSLPVLRIPLGTSPRLVEPNAAFDSAGTAGQAAAASLEALTEVRALEQLAAPAERSLYGKWIDVMTEYRGILATAKPDDPVPGAAARLKEKAPILPPRAEWLFWDAPHKAFVSTSKLLEQHVAVDLTALSDQLRAYRIAPGADQAAADAWIDSIKTLADVTKERDENQQDLHARDAALQTAQAAALATLPGAAKIALTQANLTVTFRDAATQRAAGEQTPPSGVTFIAVDAGLVAAFPTGGRSETAWLVPTLGINLYLLAPIERSVPMDQLVGPWLFQHFAVTVGFTLVNPSLPGRTATGEFLGQYLVVGGGLRLSPFTRFVAGSLIYNVADPNPGSLATRHYGAPYVGFSADFDVVKVLLGGASALIGK